MKTVAEWSLEFDRLYDNISSNKAPGLTEYEKSVFLTRAQEAVVQMMYDGTIKDSFEETEEVTKSLASLVRQATLLPSSSTQLPKICSKSYVFALPSDLLFRTYESCILTSDTLCGSPVEVSVVPVTQDEFWRTQRNPFRGAGTRKVLRLAYASNSIDNSGALSEQDYSELVSCFPVTSYTVRYVSKPRPIILEDLTGGLSINGETEARTCELPEVIHSVILDAAVKAAKAAWA